MNTIIDALKWFFTLRVTEVRPGANAEEKLLNSMRITAKCRYNASVRLRRLSSCEFMTLTAVSLGLILIPLSVVSGMKSRFPDSTLNTMQIFMAVVGLVYSVSASKARKDVRAERLTEGGDKLKDLIRHLRSSVQEAAAGGQKVDMGSYYQRYNDITTDTEDHARIDYALAILEMKDDYRLTGIGRMWWRVKVALTYFVPYMLPLILLAYFCLFILDMYGVVDCFNGQLLPFARHVAGSSNAGAGAAP